MKCKAFSNLFSQNKTSQYSQTSQNYHKSLSKEEIARVRAMGSTAHGTVVHGLVIWLARVVAGLRASSHTLRQNTLSTSTSHFLFFPLFLFNKSPIDTPPWRTMSSPPRARRPPKAFVFRKPKRPIVIFIRRSFGFLWSRGLTSTVLRVRHIVQRAETSHFRTKSVISIRASVERRRSTRYFW